MWSEWGGGGIFAMAESDGTHVPMIVRVGEEEAMLEGPPPETMLELEEKTRHALGYGPGAKFSFKVCAWFVVAAS